MSAVKEPDYVVENMKCVEEEPADGAPDFPDDCVFTFEFDIKMPRDSANGINKVLDNHYKKKYMLVINKEVYYFEFYQDVIDYVALQEVDGEKEYQLFVKDAGKYIFISGKFNTEV